jgi:hypothetical protein
LITNFRFFLTVEGKERLPVRSARRGGSQVRLGANARGPKASVTELLGVKLDNLLGAGFATANSPT